MKFLRFLGNHFQLVNFFLAALLVGILYGGWYLPSTQREAQEQALLKQKPPAEIPMQELPAIGKVEPSDIPAFPLQKPSPEIVASPQLPELSPTYAEPNLPGPSEPDYLTRANPVTVNTAFGHFPFPESPPNRLVVVGEYYGRTEMLDEEAASAFKQMQAEAKAQGVSLTIISGFRSVAAQEELFRNQTNRRGSPAAAAKYSAPAGHSEHHTGYALDIGDGSDPGNDLKVNFQNTSAFRWLVANAPRYGFEMSFPQGNAQGVSYEPWHWRYVASPRAMEIFVAARNQL